MLSKNIVLACEKMMVICRHGLDEIICSILMKTRIYDVSPNTAARQCSCTNNLFFCDLAYLVTSECCFCNPPRDVLAPPPIL